MDDFSRSEVDYAHIELLHQRHKYDEALPILSSLLEKEPSDHQARLCRLLVMRILILRHLLATKAISPPAPAAAIAVRTPAFLAFRPPSGVQLIARLRDLVYCLPVPLDRHRLAIAAHSLIQVPWSRNVQHWSRFQIISRLRNSIGAFLDWHEQHRIALTVAVPLALAVLVSVYVLVVWPVENRPRSAARSAIPNSASRAMVTAAKPQPGDGTFSKPWIVTSANSALEPSTFHRVLTRSDDLNWSLLDLEYGAPSSSGEQNIASRTAAAERKAPKKEETGVATVNDNHAVVPKPVAKRLETSALKPSSNEHKNPVADAPTTIIARYQAKQLIPLRKSARFGAPTIDKIAKGTSVDVLSVNNSWAKVTLKNDVNDVVTGFVRMEFLVPDAVGSL